MADEINRTPPKTQSAQLEAMQEKITVAGKNHPLQEPFFVLATQNPFEQEGIFHLPVFKPLQVKTLSEFILLHACTSEFYENQPGICSSPDWGWIATALAGSLRLWRGETNS